MGLPDRCGLADWGDSRLTVHKRFNLHIVYASRNMENTKMEALGGYSSGGVNWRTATGPFQSLCDPCIDNGQSPLHTIAAATGHPRQGDRQDTFAPCASCALNTGTPTDKRMLRTNRVYHYNRQ